MGHSGAKRRQMLEFDNVSKSFWTGVQRKVILERASFRVELGHSLGILAPNGTGKTTLINMMAGLEKPDEGTIHRGCKISFPLGFMGGVVSRHTAKENARAISRGCTIWIPTMWRHSVAGFAISRNTLICPSAPIVRGCAHASHSR